MKILCAYPFFCKVAFAPCKRIPVLDSIINTAKEVFLSAKRAFLIAKEVCLLACSASFFAKEVCQLVFYSSGLAKESAY
jgi:hypothetical protein